MKPDKEMWQLPSQEDFKVLKQAAKERIPKTDFFPFIEAQYNDIYFLAEREHEIDPRWDDGCEWPELAFEGYAPAQTKYMKEA